MTQESDSPTERPGVIPRVFATREFFRLWLAHVFTAFGDWIAFLAIIVLARRTGGDTAGLAIALALLVRVMPGFFLAPVGGVIADRLNRKRLLITCDVTRAVVLVALPLVDTLWGLVLASLVLGLATSLWGLAKEAIVHDLMPKDRLTEANSLSLVAAYGTFVFASIAFTGLGRVSDWLAEAGRIDLVSVNRDALTLYVAAATFFFGAGLVASLPLVARSRSERSRTDKRIDLGLRVRELREGWNFIFLSPTVRAVLVGLGMGMIGGGMLIPLGAVFNADVLGGVDDGFGVLVTALGVGVAVGVALLSTLQSRFEKSRAFVGSVFGAGSSLFLAVSVSELWATLIGVFVLGIAAGSVYVLGFTILHESVDDELRGRVFSALYTVLRFCLLVSIVVGGLLSESLDWVFEELFDSEIGIRSAKLQLIGVRGALWLAATTMWVGGGLALVSLRRDRTD